MYLICTEELVKFHFEQWKYTKLDFCLFTILEKSMRKYNIVGGNFAGVIRSAQGGTGAN